jgi:hypothetical protein
MTTLFDILSKSYRSLGQLEVYTATGGSTSTVVSTNIGQDAIGDDDPKGGTLFLIRDAGGASAAPQDEARLITGYVSSTQTFTVSPVFSVAPATGDTFGVAKSVYLLETMIELVNDALANLGTIQYVDTSLTTLEDTFLYTLPISAKYKLVKVEISDADGDNYATVLDWAVYPSTPGTTGLLRLPQLVSARTIKLWYDTEHPRLSAMTDKLSETIHSEYANALVLEKALSYMVNRTNGTDEFLKSEWNKAANKLDAAERKYAPKKMKITKILTPISREYEPVNQ